MAHAADLDQVARGFAHAAGDVAHVGDLRAHVEVQQLQTLVETGVLELAEQINQLARRQAELGGVATAVLPLAGAEAGQAHAYAEARLHAQSGGFFDHQRQLGRLLDDDEGLQAQPARDQRQTDVLAILVTVADHHAAGPGQRDHRHQFRLAAGFQAKRFATLARQFAGDSLVLVDLDRIHRRVATAVIPVGHGLGEGTLQAAQAVAEHVREAQQHRQLQSLAGGLVDRFRNPDRRPGITQWPRHHVAAVVHVVIAFRPVRNGPDAAGVVEGPVSHVSSRA